MTATDEVFRREVGRRVRLNRLVQRLTQQDVADRAGVSRSFVSLFEKGGHGIDVLALRRIALALGVPLSELVTEPGDEPIRHDVIRRVER